MKCKPGDMAVVLTAFHKSNVGMFVNIVELYGTGGGMNLACSQPVWLVESYAPLTWTRGNSLWHGSRGPVPDAALQPVRGLKAGGFRASCMTINK